MSDPVGGPARRLSENPRILVVKFMAIGDLIMITPALRDLRKTWPKAHITLLTGIWSAEALRRNPGLDEILAFDQQMFVERRWGDIWRLLREVRRRRYDAAVILHAPLLIHLFVRMAGIPLRYGMSRGRMGGLLLTRSVPERLGPGLYYGRKYQQVAALAGAVTGSCDPEAHASDADARDADRLLAEAGVAPGEEFLLIAPGGGRNPLNNIAAKRWPAERFAALARKALESRPGLRVVLSGSENDRLETGVLAGALPGCADLTGKLSLPQLIAVAGRARAVLCNDSAILHIGVGRGTPSVAPFGPTGSLQLVPPRALPYVFQSDAACSPCLLVGGGKSFAGCPIGFQCMREASVDRLLPYLEKALDAPRA